MKIVHLCLANFLSDNFSYQENMLPKFHKKMGLEVEIIASLETFDSSGKPTHMKEASTYINENNIKVTRLEYKNNFKITKKLKKYKNLYEKLIEAKPDIIFIHGCQFLDIKEVKKYLKKVINTIVYVDNHADYFNSATNWLSKNILHKIIWRHCAHKIEPFTTKFYGVTPIRVEFLKKIYKLPENKCELLVMGVDDELVKSAIKSNSRDKIRKRFDISSNDFLIMTGGKIDHFKTQTLLLMKAVGNIEHKKVKLLIFGSVSSELKEEFEKLCIDNKIIYAGWIKSEESYDYFSAADLVVFAGAHSVFWEQVAGQGIPMVCKYWKGVNHVDLNGNVEFLYEDSVDEIYLKISEIITNEKKYELMKKVAIDRGMKVFSYEQIAKRSIAE